MLLAQTTQQKRLEFKEASYQEQLKKAADRYVAAEGERQKLTLDFNNLMARMEEAEKKYLLSSKEKDRAYAD